MIVVTGSVTAHADGFEALRQACLDHCARSRGEPGCIQHTVHVDCESPLRLFFYEQWTDESALEAHLKTPGLAEFMTTARALAASAERTAFHEAKPIRRPEAGSP